MSALRVLAIALGLAASLSAWVPPAAADDIPLSPVTISISDEGANGYAVRHFPSRLRLYTFDMDRPGVSACTESCAAAWPPVRGTASDRPVGDWTLIARGDGAPQWAFRGKPVYLRYHDRPEAPTGDGVDGAWHLIPNIPKAR